MSVRIGTRVGKSSWLSMGIFGWLFVGLLGLLLFTLLGFWPVVLLQGAFPKQAWASVVGWILTVVWWFLLLGWAIARSQREKKQP